MTSSSVNFSFLANISPDLDGLHRYARQAEMYLHSDPNSCLVKLRQFGELLAQEIAVRNGESIFQGEAQYDLLCRLRNKGILRQKSSDPFHRIREDGNQASHDRLDDHNRALKRLKDAHHLACCFYKTHIKECEIATFTVPLNLEIDLDRITQQLSSVTESNDLLNNRLIEKEIQLDQLLLAKNNDQETINKQLVEIKYSRNLLEQEIESKDTIFNHLKEIEQQSIRMTSAEKQATIIRYHQQEENIVATEVDNLEPGILLRDRYEIVKQLGSGSFSVTYIARDRDFPKQKLFAIKQFNSAKLDVASTVIARDKFTQEAEILARLSSEYIPKLYAQFEDNGVFYIVQDLVDGIPLTQELQIGKQENEQYIKQLIIDILTPLVYIHEQNIIHRDLKPDNLIRRTDGKVSLIDFGAVKEVLTQTTSQTGTTIGTPGYMPCEQVDGRPKLSSDIYAVGKIIIQAATGINPSDLSFDQDENLIWQNFAPQLSQELKNVLSRMVEYDFRVRYPNATEALNAVNSLLMHDIKAESIGKEKILQEENIEIMAADISRSPIARIGYPKIIGALVGLVIMGIGIKSWDYLTKPKVSNSTITVGILTSPADYRELGDYLRKELVPANYFDYLQGKQVGIIIEGDKSLSYQEVKKRLAAKKWDIVFARSPMIARFSQKQSYSYLAGMFPGSPTYKSGIFVKANSPIRSINDIKSNTVVALGDFNSASGFYMPVYDLYGKTFSAKIARNQSPRSMVSEGKAEVGTVAIGDQLKPNNPEFRIIHTSRNIPGSGVYLSPQFASQHEQIKQVLLAASKSITKKVNYGDVPEPNYTEFDKITDRVDSIIECVDFDKSPVNLFCDKSANRLTN
jgi:serine/threonine protein kinase